MLYLRISPGVERHTGTNFCQWWQLVSGGTNLNHKSERVATKEPRTRIQSDLRPEVIILCVETAWAIENCSLRLRQLTQLHRASQAIEKIRHMKVGYPFP